MMEKGVPLTLLKYLCMAQFASCNNVVCIYLCVGFNTMTENGVPFTSFKCLSVAICFL